MNFWLADPDQSAREHVAHAQNDHLNKLCSSYCFCSGKNAAQSLLFVAVGMMVACRSVLLSGNGGGQR